MVSRFERLMGCASIPLGQSPPEDDNTQCSGRGDCLNGTCLCEIRYSGDECSGFNLPYHAGKNPSVIFPSNFPNKKNLQSAGISSVFYFVAFISLVQLMICIIAEYQRLKQPSFLRACRLTTQKLLYFFVFIASVLRGAYFTTPVRIGHYLCGAQVLNLGLCSRFSFLGNTPTGVGFLSYVGVLSARDDLRLARRLPVG